MRTVSAKVLVIAPMVGSTGDVVNERQVVLALSRYSKEVIAITPIGIKSLIKREYKPLLSNRPLNMRILLIPFTLIPSTSLEILNVVVFTIYSLVISFLVLVLDVVKHFDIIYIRDARFAFAAMFFSRLARKCLVKVAAIYEDELYTKFLRGLVISILRSIDRHVLLNAAGVVVHSVEFAKALISRRGIIPKHIYILPPGITKYTINAVKKYCRRKCIDRNRVVVGFLGFLAPWQGVDILCDIVAKLKEMGYNAKLKIVGDGPLRRYVVRRCASLNVDVEITGFMEHHKALCIARKEFDVMVLPRIRSETTSTILPIKVVEALALEIPVVVTNLPIYKNFDGMGVYLAERNAKEFAKVIAMMLSSSNIKLNIETHKTQKDLVLRYLYEYNVKKVIDEIYQR